MTIFYIPNLIQYLNLTTILLTVYRQQISRFLRQMLSNGINNRQINYKSILKINKQALALSALLPTKFLITQHNHTGSAWGQMSGYSSDAQKAQVMLVSRGIMLLQRVNDHLYRLMYVQPSALKHFCVFNYWWLMLPFTVVYPSYEKWRLPGCAWSRVLLLVVRFRLMKLWLICSHRSRIWLSVWFKCQIQLYVIGRF